MNENGGDDILRSIVERIERIQAQRDELAEDIREIKAEAKSQGFHLPAIAALLRERRMDEDKRAILEANLEAYRAAIGDLKGTPLGQAAEPR